MTAYVADAAGLVTEKTGPLAEEHWSYRYDMFGQLASRGAPRDRRLEGGHLELRVQARERRDGEGDGSLGYATERWYNARQKLLKESRTDSAPDRTSTTNERTIELTYDGPWVAKQIVKEGASVATLERQRYDHRGRVLYEVETFAGPDASAGYTYATDVPWNGRVANTVTQTWSTASTSSGSRTGQREVDALENVILQSWGSFTNRWTFDAAGRLGEENLFGKPQRKLAYAEGLLTSITYGDEATTSGYWASGKLRTTTTPDGRSRRLTWDDRGLLAKEEYGRDGSVDTKQYGYDAAGNLQSMKHGLGPDLAEWTYASGPRGELLSVTQPDAGAFQYAYNDRGELRGITSPQGGGSAAQSFDYDYLGRQITRVRGGATWTTSWSSGTATIAEPNDTVFGTRTVYRGLDGRGRPAVERYSGVAGDLTQVVREFDVLDQPLRVTETRGSGEVALTYAYADARKLLTGITRAETLRTEAITYGRTASGQLQYVEAPSGRVSYGYDGLDRLQTITAGQQSTTLTWEAGGERLLDAEDLTRLHECRRYDERGRVTLVGNVGPGEPCEQSYGPSRSSGTGTTTAGTGRSRSTRTRRSRISERTSYGYDKTDRLDNGRGESERHGEAVPARRGREPAPGEGGRAVPGWRAGPGGLERLRRRRPDVPPRRAGRAHVHHGSGRERGRDVHGGRRRARARRGARCGAEELHLGRVRAARAGDGDEAGGGRRGVGRDARIPLRPRGPAGGENERVRDGAVPVGCGRGASRR